MYICCYNGNFRHYFVHYEVCLQNRVVYDCRVCPRSTFKTETLQGTLWRLTITVTLKFCSWVVKILPYYYDIILSQGVHLLSERIFALRTQVDLWWKGSVTKSAYKTCCKSQVSHAANVTWAIHFVLSLISTVTIPIIQYWGSINKVKWRKAAHKSLTQADATSMTSVVANCTYSTMPFLCVLCENLLCYWIKETTNALWFMSRSPSCGISVAMC